MPITKSAIKALKQAKKRTENNRAIKSRAKTALDAMKATPSEANLAKAFSTIDRAVKNHIFHRNKAGHLKSQLSKLLVAGAKAAPKVEKVAKKAVETVAKTAVKAEAAVAKTAKKTVKTVKKTVAKAK